MVDESSIESLTIILQLFNAFGVTAVLYVFLRMFIRGDILPRVVYERMAERMLAEMAARVVAGVRDLIEQWRSEASDQGKSDAS